MTLTCLTYVQQKLPDTQVHIEQLEGGLLNSCCGGAGLGFVQCQQSKPSTTFCRFDARQAACWFACSKFRYSSSTSKEQCLPGIFYFLIYFPCCFRTDDSQPQNCIAAETEASPARPMLRCCLNSSTAVRANLTARSQILELISNWAQTIACKHRTILRLLAVTKAH